MKQPRLFRGAGKWNCAHAVRRTASWMLMDNLGRGDTPKAAYASWKAVNKPQSWLKRWFGE